MSILDRFALWFLLVFNLGCSHSLDFSQLGEQNSHQEQRILITFVDQTLMRNLPANSQDQYHSRQSYQNSSWSERLAENLANRYHLQLLSQWPMTEIGVSCVVYQIPASLAINETISQLQNEPNISSVQAMQHFQVANDLPIKSGYSDPYLPLQTAFNTYDIAEWHKNTSGRGIRISLIDSGVDTDHPDLKGQINYLENMAPEPNDHNLADKHGTAVAGVLSARANNGIGIVGIAPDAEVLALRACWPEQPNALAAHCNSFTLALALNQAIRLNSQIINLSLTGPKDALLQQLIEKAQSRGIIIVAALPENNLQGRFPANMPSVLAVSHTRQNIDQSIIAPGHDILTTVPHEAYDFMTGSSFATPHVSGLAALLLQLHPNWQANDIKQQLLHPESLADALQIH